MSSARSGRSCFFSSVRRATVCPSYATNSTSNAAPLPWTSTAVPTSPALSPCSGKSQLRATGSSSLILFIFARADVQSRNVAHRYRDQYTTRSGCLTQCRQVRQERCPPHSACRISLLQFPQFRSPVRAKSNYPPVACVESEFQEEECLAPASGVRRVQKVTRDLPLRY